MMQFWPFLARTILLPEGNIDRKRLGEIIFNDPDKKAGLDAIVHPLVFERSAEMIAQIAAKTPDAVVIMDVPLLIEADMGRDLEEVIVVYVPETLQLKRRMNRDGIDEQSAMARIRSQYADRGETQASHGCHRQQRHHPRSGDGRWRFLTA